MDSMFGLFFETVFLFVAVKELNVDDTFLNFFFFQTYKSGKNGPFLFFFGLAAAAENAS